MVVITGAAGQRKIAADLTLPKLRRRWTHRGGVRRVAGTWVVWRGGARRAPQRRGGRRAEGEAGLFARLHDAGVLVRVRSVRSTGARSPGTRPACPAMTPAMGCRSGTAVDGRPLTDPALAAPPLTPPWSQWRAYRQSDRPGHCAELREASSLPRKQRRPVPQRITRHASDLWIRARSSTAGSRTPAGAQGQLAMTARFGIKSSQLPGCPNLFSLWFNPCVPVAL